MAEETAMTNGVEENQAAADSFYDLDQGGNETKLKQKIASLETEKKSLGDENDEIKFPEESNLKLRVAELEREVEQSEEAQRALESIAGRAAELETHVSRLQHDLISAMSDGDEANKEVAELKREVSEKEVRIEEVKKEKSEAEKKVRELERKIGVLEVKEIEEKSKKVRLEEDMREKLSEKDKEIIECKKRIKELESQVVEKERLEKKLRESEEKMKEMEGKMVELQKEAKKAEEVIGGLKDWSKEVIDGIEIDSRQKGFKGQSPVVAIGSVGAVAVAAAVVYVCYSRRQ
ncbi:hypothetical protein OIU85_021479 [Salix viminalis]|uniref:Peroxisomal and mitochondrial division factor 2-like n=1 Tax=Salix viminalis TaxID=40686 RepID=A0A9Q0UIE5_SALVM|nr:hypothetical protein OIU85_021479 [Salix viminalis]